MRRRQFVEQLRRLPVPPPLTEQQAEALWRHYELLERWNARINLTRVIELEEAVRFHYGESLFLCSLLPAEVRTVADVGSGAGFPGFVIAVARPELEVTLIESDQRKAAFLREASDLAPNVRVVAKRSSEVEGAFDVAVARAVRAEEVMEFARRACRWVMWIGTETPGGSTDLEWRVAALPDGRGQVWVARMGTAGR
jgi:16S rRNA (guanine(527)-N(7))-methyltransferase RsmG